MIHGFFGSPAVLDRSEDALAEAATALRDATSAA